MRPNHPLPIMLLLLVPLMMLAISMPTLAFGQEEEVKIDSFDGDGEVILQAGQVIGDILAVRLVPTTTCPCRVTGIKWILAAQPPPNGNPPGIGQFLVRIWDDPGTSRDPGALIAEFGVEQLSSQDQFILSDLTTETFIVDGPFRVGFELFEQNDPANPVYIGSEGLDFGPGDIPILPTPTPEQNTVFDVATGQWKYMEEFGFSGDLIIRAIVEPAAANPVPLAPWLGVGGVSTILGLVGYARLRRPA